MTSSPGSSSSSSRYPTQRSYNTRSSCTVLVARSPCLLHSFTQHEHEEQKICKKECNVPYLLQLGGLKYEYECCDFAALVLVHMELFVTATSQPREPAPFSACLYARSAVEWARFIQASFLATARLDQMALSDCFETHKNITSSIAAAVLNSYILRSML